ncbi:UNVERIFIED_CONTAM: hypothetical protein K2H54_066113 [Gekko kuhli]
MSRISLNSKPPLGSDPIYGALLQEEEEEVNSAICATGSKGKIRQRVGVPKAERDSGGFTCAILSAVGTSEQPTAVNRLRRVLRVALANSPGHKHQEQVL